jgi:hypothetical protein
LQNEISPEGWVQQFHAWPESHDRTTLVDTNLLLRTLQPWAKPLCLACAEESLPYGRAAQLGKRERIEPGRVSPGGAQHLGKRDNHQ